mgnify:FL=1
MKNKKLFYGILVVLVLGVLGVLFMTFTPSSPIEVGTPTESKYCVNYLGNPDPEGSCATIEIEARKCGNIGDCRATCGFGCINKNWDMRGRNDCEAIPQYECECINNFCQIK